MTPITSAQNAATSAATQFKWQQFAQQSTEQQIQIGDPPVDQAHPGSPRKKRVYIRYIAIACAIVLATTLFFVWHTTSTSASPAPGIAQQNFDTTTASTSTSQNSTTADTNTTTSTTNGEIQVYVVGAVKHPGVYNLPADARIYQLVQAAGGTLPNANLVALNLAARLTDGQEVYVVKIGEIPPTYVGGVPEPGNGTSSTNPTTSTSIASHAVNINTASATDLRLGLHVSSKTAQDIVNYRLQHGAYSSVDQLLQVVSKAIYTKIKDLVTV